MCEEWALQEGCDWVGLKCAQTQGFTGRLGGLTSGTGTLARKYHETTCRDLILGLSCKDCGSWIGAWWKG